MKHLISKQSEYQLGNVKFVAQNYEGAISLFDQAKFEKSSEFLLKLDDTESKIKKAIAEEVLVERF